MDMSIRVVSMRVQTHVGKVHLPSLKVTNKENKNVIWFQWLFPYIYKKKKREKGKKRKKESEKVYLT